MPSTEQVVAQGQLMARFVFRVPSGEGWYRQAVGGVVPEPSELDEGAWTPKDVERVFAAITKLFTLADQMAHEPPREGDEAGYLHSGFGTFMTRLPFSRQEVSRERRPLEIVSLNMGSLEIVLAISGALASPKVLGGLLALIEEAFTLQPRIRARRVTYEAERLEAEVRAAKAKRELVVLAARQLPASAPMTDAEFWIEGAEANPELSVGVPAG